jgi:hypothetical protein
MEPYMLPFASEDGKALKNFLQRLIGFPSRPAANPAQDPTPVAESETPKPDIDSRQAKVVVQEGYGDENAQTKMDSSRCDLHPLYRLNVVRIPTKSPTNANANMKALCCTKSTCDRQYASEWGYFRLIAGESYDFGALETKPRCEINHDRRYMVVTKLNGRFLWACPEAGCRNAIPYEEPSG